MTQSDTNEMAPVDSQYLTYQNCMLRYDSNAPRCLVVMVFTKITQYTCISLGCRSVGELRSTNKAELQLHPPPKLL